MIGMVTSQLCPAISQDSSELGRHFCSEVHAVEVTVKLKERNPVLYFYYLQQSLMNMFFLKLSLLCTLSHNRAKKQNSNEQLCKSLRLKSIHYYYYSLFINRGVLFLGGGEGHEGASIPAHHQVPASVRGRQVSLRFLAASFRGRQVSLCFLAASVRGCQVSLRFLAP